LVKKVHKASGRNHKDAKTKDQRREQWSLDGVPPFSIQEAGPPERQTAAALSGAEVVVSGAAAGREEVDNAKPSLGAKPCTT
jgi:hypothetical protein